MDISSTKIIIYIDNYKFDVTDYADTHPGGRQLLEQYNNKDATYVFNMIKGHFDDYIGKLLDDCCIGPCDK